MTAQTRSHLAARPSTTTGPLVRVGSVEDDVVVFDSSSDDYTCPDCGHTLVPTDDQVPDLRMEHACVPTDVSLS